jgi:hypothetical protein
MCTAVTGNRRALKKWSMPLIRSSWRRGQPSGTIAACTPRRNERGTNHSTTILPAAANGVLIAVNKQPYS